MTWCTTHRARAWLLARAALAATGLGGLSFACSTDGRTLEPSESLTRIGIVPESTEVQPDQTVQFRAYGVSTRGNTEAVDVRWEATGGTISDSGLYTAARIPGEFSVTATNTGSQPLRATASIRIRLVLQQIIVTPGSATLAPGATQQFEAFGRAATGDSMPVNVTFTPAAAGAATATLEVATSVGPQSVTLTGTGGTAAAAGTGAGAL